MNFADRLERWIAPVKRAVQSMILKAVVESVDDSNALQLLKVTIGRDESMTGVERLQPFGITSVPAEGDEALVLSVGGEKEHAVIIAVDSSGNRPTGLSDGEVCIYRNDTNKIYLKANGDVVIECGGDIKIGGDTLTAALDGVVTKQCICAYTGVAHPDASSKVMAAKS